MKILSPEQVRQWDRYTIEKENISSLDLMERAASRCFDWMVQKGFLKHSFLVFCGKGNNGGDGLAIARMLAKNRAPVKVYILEFGHLGSDDFQANLNRLHDAGVSISFIQSNDQFPELANEFIIDAIFGSGLNRPSEGLTASLINYLNGSGKPVISIDIPTGMFADTSSKEYPVIKASYTLTFQCYKLAFLLPENESFIGKLVILDIGLHPAYLDQIQPELELVEMDFVQGIYKPRKRFGHKGTYGHALITGGSFGKIGAVILACTACLRAGAGLVSAYIPSCGYQVMQTALPEAMVITDVHDRLIAGNPPDLSKYTVLGIGPGMGTDVKTMGALERLISSFHQPMVIDADALNMIASNYHFMDKVHALSILTPHPREFERMFGKTENDFERLALARKKAKELELIIILKGHHTFIAMPGGKGYFNTTGNPGMATGGSGDILTGILAGLLAQGYQPAQAAIFGVYLHGLAGDLAVTEKSEEGMIASDISDHLPAAFKLVNEFNFQDPPEA